MFDLEQFDGDPVELEVQADFAEQQARICHKPEVVEESKVCPQKLLADGTEFDCAFEGSCDGEPCIFEDNKDET